MAHDTDESASWHLDKRVPVALIFAIIMQTAAAFGWVVRMEVLQEQAQKERERLEVRIGSAENMRNETATRLIRVEEKLSNTEGTLNQILQEVRKK